MNIESRFSRTEMLLGKESMDLLTGSAVAVFGLGGVGGAAVEALTRSGIGTINIIDNDTVSISNINRQIIATDLTIGIPKTEAMMQRIRSINPDAKVIAYSKYFTEENAEEFDFSGLDYIVDAIDSVKSKIALIMKARQYNIPIISCMGAGNKLDPTKFEVADIKNTSVCPLARIMRKALKERGIDSLKVVFSSETPDGHTILTTTQGGSKRAPGSVSFVPPVAGYIMAGEVVKDLIKHAGIDSKKQEE